MNVSKFATFIERLKAKKCFDCRGLTLCPLTTGPCTLLDALLQGPCYRLTLCVIAMPSFSQHFEYATSC